MAIRIYFFLSFLLLVISTTELRSQNCYGYRDTSFNHISHWVFDSSHTAPVSTIYDMVEMNNKLYFAYRSNIVPSLPLTIKGYDILDTAQNQVWNHSLFVDSDFVIGTTSQYVNRLHQLTDSNLLLTSYKEYSYTSLAMVGFKTDMSKETTFGLGGTTLVELTPFDYYGEPKVIRNKGIFIPYYNLNSTGVIKYNVNGFPDLAFNGGISNLEIPGDFKMDKVEVFNDTIGIAFGLHNAGIAGNEVFLYLFNLYTGLPDSSLLGSPYKFISFPNPIFSIRNAKYDIYSGSFLVSLAASGQNQIIKLNLSADQDMSFGGDGVLTVNEILGTSFAGDFNEINLSDEGKFFTNYQTGYAYITNDAMLETSFGYNGQINLLTDSLNFHLQSIKDLFFDFDLKKAYLIGPSANIISTQHHPTIVRLNVSSCFIGIDENDSFTPLIYPNPTNNFICFNYIDECEMKVFDMLGNKQKIRNIDEGCVDISELPAGLYNLFISTKAGEKSIQKFIKYD